MTAQKMCNSHELLKASLRRENLHNRMKRQAGVCSEMQVKCTEQRQLTLMFCPLCELADTPAGGTVNEIRYSLTSQAGHPQTGNESFMEEHPSIITIATRHKLFQMRVKISMCHENLAVSGKHFQASQAPVT